MRFLSTAPLLCLLLCIKDAVSFDHKLEESSSGLWSCSNRGWPETWSDVSNMLTRWVQADPARRAKPFRDVTRTTAFSYIDTYEGHQLVLDDDDDYSIEQVFQVLDRDLTEPFDDKYSFHLAAKEAGVEGNFVPSTYFTKEEALEFLPDEVDIVFIKHKKGTLGEGITMLPLEDLPDTRVPPDHIIQEGLTKNLALLDGSKLTVRAYFVIMHGRIYCHHSTFLDFQHHPFDPLNTSRDVQISHAGGTGHLDLRFPLRTPEHVNGSEGIWRVCERYQLESIVNGTKWMSSFVELGRKLGPLLEPVVRETHKDPLRFAFWGVDLIPFEDGSFKLLEINIYPSFRRSDVMTDIILRALHMDKYDTDLETRLVEAWKLPDEAASGDDLQGGSVPVKDRTSEAVEKDALSMEENSCSAPSRSRRVWKKSIYTASEYIVAGRNLAEYNGTETSHNDDINIPPFELFDTFDISDQITGNEGYWDLIDIKNKLDNPTLSFYTDKVARKRWLPTKGIEQPVVYSLKYRRELTESQELEDETQAIVNLLPNESNFVAKPSHKARGYDCWLAGYDDESGVSRVSPVPNKMEAVPEAEMKPQIATSLARSLHETLPSTATFATLNVKPGIVVEERWTHPFHDHLPPVEFKIVCIWGRVWVGAFISPEEDGRHIHAYIYRDGSTAPGSAYAKTPNWIDWEHLIAIAEKLSANKDLARTDIFVGIPAGSVRPDATREERLDAVKYGVNEVEMAPKTILFQCGQFDGCENDLSLEGARLWLAGYKMGNYKVVPNTEVPLEWVESGGYYPEDPQVSNAINSVPNPFIRVENDLLNPKYGTGQVPFPFRVFDDQSLQDQVPQSLPVPDFVRVYEFVTDKIKSVSLFELGASARQVLDANMPSSEGVLFRNLHERIKTAADFAKFWDGVLSAPSADNNGQWENMPFMPRNCTERNTLDGVDLSVNIPNEVLLRLHYEMGYNPRPPTRVGFYCLQDAYSGGETMLSLTTELSRNMPDNIRPFLAAHGGVLHKRKYFNDWFSEEKHCMSWQFKTGATTVKEALHFFTKHGWKEEDITIDENKDLTIQFKHSGYIRYNETNEEVFVNHMQPHSDPMADGSSIPNNLVREIQLAMWKSACSFRLQRGDWLVVDNMKVLHGRYPVKDSPEKQRKMLVVYGESPRHRTYERVVFD